MEIRTFTNFWNIEKKIYSVYDLQLPFAISLRSIGIFIGTAVPYWIILNIFAVPVNLQTLLIWIAVPALLATFGNRPIFEGKSLLDYIKSRVKFLFESKKYKGLLPATEKYGRVITVSDHVYTVKK